MKYDLELLKTDIKHELEKMQRLENEFNEKIAAMLSRKAEEVPNYDRGAIGYLLHNFYNGCENIFRSIADFFENDFTNKSWHRDILKRMTLEIEGYRPKVISENLFILLDDFRGFRHKFRYSYSFELDWEREKIVADKQIKAWKLLQDDLDIFIKKLDLLNKE